MRKLSIVVMVLSFFVVGCNPSTSAPVADSGVKKVSVNVPTDPNGMTVEQKNIADRLLTDNAVGVIKHFYVISAYSGQVIIYSTVRGKITSSGKRLTPKTVMAANGNSGAGNKGIPVVINGSRHYTSEVLQDDGAYGDSIPYLFWYDAKGVYHQHFVTGGQIPHLSDQPIAVKSVILNMEVSEAK